MRTEEIEEELRKILKEKDPEKKNPEKKKKQDVWEQWKKKLERMHGKSF